MSFDDFCNVFRYLYVCKYYDKDKWHHYTIPGFWKKAVVVAESKAAGSPGRKGKSKKLDEDEEAEKREEALAKMDTCGGLPSVDNPGCILENNPFYSLKILRPTDIRLCISQRDSRGKSSGDVHPFSAFICKSPNQSQAQRLTTMAREDIVVQMSEITTERERSLYASLKPGLYVVLIGTYVANLEGKFSVTLSTNYRVSFESLWPPRWVVQPGDLSAEDVMKQMALKGVMELGKNFKEMWKNLMILRKDLLGTGANIDEEEDDDDEDD
jgi:hypothetical protein